MLKLQNVSRLYTEGTVVQALYPTNLTIEQGEFVAIKGPSGCGKSTLLYLLGLLDAPDTGEYCFENERVDQLSRIARAHLRNRSIGFVFQSFNLLSRTSAFDNVLLPLQYGQTPEAATKVRTALEKVGLWDRRQNWSNQLSGGQQQRVAIARALVNDPKLILADEPTGNLDSKTGLDVMKLFQSIHAEGRTIVMVTHNDELINYASRVITMKDGLIIDDTRMKGRN